MSDSLRPSSMLPEGAVRLSEWTREAHPIDAGWFLLFPAWSQRESGQREFRTRVAQSEVTAAEPVFFRMEKRPGRPFPEQIGVGRARNADLCLPFPDVSKYHACFFGGAGGWELIDAGSANGTTVDGEPLAPRERVALGDGSRISFAGHVCFVQTAPSFRIWLQNFLRLKGAR